MIGKQIGNYRIESELGSGGMGTVYRGTELNLDRPVAIKVLNADLARKPEILERFRAEAKAQANLHHTNVATLYAFVTHEGNAMMVMEFIDGENFQEMVKRRGAIPYAEAIPLFQQALAGIGAAHRMGIVHRDMKPANIMLNKQGVVKVMDFGIAKLMGERGLTRTGVQIGTVYYMSPEQVKGLAADERSDIYALGVTLYEILTAQVPFPGESEFDVLTDHVNAPPPRLSAHAQIPGGIEHAVLKALEKRPENRFQTVAEFAAALDNPVSPSMATTADISHVRPVRDFDLTRPPPTSPPTGPKKRERPWIAFVGGMLVVAGLGIGAFLFLSDKPATTSRTPSARVNVENPPAAVAPPPEPVITETTIPAETEIEVTLTSAVDAGRSVEGQVFAATVKSPDAAHGDAQLRIVRLAKAKRFKGVARLEFELSGILSGEKIYRPHASTFKVEGARGKFLGFGSGSLKIAAGTPMSFTLIDPLTVTVR